MRRPARAPGSSDRPRCVAFLHDNVQFGGIETLQLNVLKHLDSERYRGVVVVEEYAPSASSRFRDQLAAIEVPLLTPDRGASGRGPRAGQTILRLQQLLRREQVDVAHIQTRTPESSRRLTMGAFLARVPALIRTEHVSPGPHLGRFTRYTVRPFDWMTDLVFTDSLADRQEQIDLVGRRPDQVVASYCGIDPYAFDPDHDVDAAKRALGIDPSVLVVGSVGRLHQQKGHRYLLEAAVRVLAKHDGPVTFLVVGDGPDEDELRALAVDEGIADHVRFVGFQPDAVPFMEAMDVVAMPSLWEGFSISMQEFMALGKAMVTSDHHSFREAIVNGEHGVIVPMRDSVALADEILRLLDDDALRRRLGQAACVRARRDFSIQRHVDELMDSYDAVLDRHADR